MRATRTPDVSSLGTHARARDHVLVFYLLGTRTSGRPLTERSPRKIFVTEHGQGLAAGGGQKHEGLLSE